MDRKKAIREIELYFELFPMSTNVDTVKLPELDTYQHIFSCGMFAKEDKEKKNYDMRFVEDILNRCSDDVLNQLMDQYGEESEFGQLIRKMRAKQSHKKILIDGKQVKQNIEGIMEASNGRRSNPFYEAVCQYIDKKGYKSDADFYNSIFMPRQLFARLRDPDASLSKKTVLWIIIGLKLSFDEAEKLLSLAGFSFRKNVKQDIVLSYILRNTAYDLFFVNEILDYFDCETFG